MTSEATESGHRTGFVGIVGRPNVGKSTLLNKLVGEQVAIATPKPQTTRDRIRGIRTWDDWQAVFVDTPGIHEPRTRLNRYMVDLAVGTLAEVDLAYLLVDAPALIERQAKNDAENERIIGYVAEAKTPTFLLVNKIDMVKDKGLLLPMIERLAGLHAFAEVVPISARRGEGLEALLQLTRERLPEGPAMFDADELTDRPVRFLAAELVREQLIMQLGQELPYHAAVRVDAWEERPNGTVALYATIVVGRKSHKPIVVGRAGAKIKAIGQSSRLRIERFLERSVYLDLRVKVDEGWIDKPDALRELGYEE